jgi:hypothetical protein
VQDFTNSIRKPVRRLLKANETPSIQHFMNVFHGCTDCSNVEFQSFVFRIYEEYRNGGPAKKWSMLELLDKLDVEYHRILALGRWEKGKNPEILALTAQIISLQAQMQQQLALTAALGEAVELPSQTLHNMKNERASSLQILRHPVQLKSWNTTAKPGSFVLPVLLRREIGTPPTLPLNTSQKLRWMPQVALLLPLLPLRHLRLWLRTWPMLI